MGDFSAPPGDGAQMLGAANQFGTVGSDVKHDIGTVKSAVQTALASWNAPRADEFRSAAFGIQAELILVADATEQVATIAHQFATAWSAADTEIAGYRTKADTLRASLKDAGGPPEILSINAQIEHLSGLADDARTALKKLGDSLAASVDAHTDRLVPKGSTLSPADIRRRVNGSTGVTTQAPTGAAAAWAMMGKATIQGKQVLDLAEDNMDGEKVGGPVTSLPVNPAILKDLLDAARQDQITPMRYAGLLHQYWVAKAAAKAGIDLNAWDPSKGTDGNLSTISAVYTYYGKLFLDHPDKLQWAGMANMIGPSFAGGFLDLHMFKDIAGNILGPASDLPGWAKDSLPPPLNAISKIGDLSASELSWYESKFLAMQKHIFFDQGAMHEAYVEGGQSAITEMHAAGLIDDRANQAWQDIDSGDPTRIQQGNTNLLYREQNQVIDGQYDQMRNHDGPVGEAMTYLMTTVGSASIAGTKTPAEYKALGFGISESTDTLGVGQNASVDVKTSLPGFNVSDKDSRWDYVTHDTLPAYQKMLADDPAGVRRIVGSNVDGRIDDQRLAHRWPKLAGDLLTDWDIDVHAGVHVGPLGISF